MPVRNQQKARHNQKAHGQRQQLRARHQSYGVADQPDQRERAHAAEGIGALRRLALLALQSNQKRQK